MPTQEFIAFAHHLADLSNEIAKKYFRLPNGEMAKADQSPVTKADREIEEIIRAEIEKNFQSTELLAKNLAHKILMQNLFGFWIRLMAHRLLLLVVRFLAH